MLVAVIGGSVVVGDVRTGVLLVGAVVLVGAAVLVVVAVLVGAAVFVVGFWVLVAVAGGADDDVKGMTVELELF